MLIIIATTESVIPCHCIIRELVDSLCRDDTDAPSDIVKYVLLWEESFEDTLRLVKIYPCMHGK